MKTTQERFEEKYTPEPMSGCWLWTASVGNHGYGQFYKHRKMRKAHRVSYELYNGPIPKGEGYHGTCVLHKCDIMTCVNPDHLFLGTHKENIADMESKGRGIHPNGEDAGGSKLTTNDVINIRRLYAKGDNSQRKLAKDYNICQGTINQVVTRKTWRHV